MMPRKPRTLPHPSTLVEIAPDDELMFKGERSTALAIGPAPCRQATPYMDRSLIPTQSGIKRSRFWCTSWKMCVHRSHMEWEMPLLEQEIPLLKLCSGEQPSSIQGRPDESTYRGVESSCSAKGG